MAYINLAQVMYPVGAIYASSSSTSPASLFSGTWSQLTGDACLMAGTSVGNVGSKTISVNQMPSHAHIMKNSIYSHRYNANKVNANRLIWSEGNDHGDDLTTTTSTGGGKLLALLLQMLYVEKNCLRIEVNYGLR